MIFTSILLAVMSLAGVLFPEQILAEPTPMNRALFLLVFIISALRIYYFYRKRKTL